MENAINELRTIISDEAQNDRMDSMTYHAILTRLDYMERRFLELNKNCAIDITICDCEFPHISKNIVGDLVCFTCNSVITKPKKSVVVKNATTER